jgi:hypothetical protein
LPPLLKAVIFRSRVYRGEAIKSQDFSAKKLDNGYDLWRPFFPAYLTCIVEQIWSLEQKIKINKNGTHRGCAPFLKTPWGS